MCPPLYRICLARVRDAVREQQRILAIEQVTYERQSRFREEVRLGSIGRENVRECVER